MHRQRLAPVGDDHLNHPSHAQNPHPQMPYSAYVSPVAGPGEHIQHSFPIHPSFNTGFPNHHQPHIPYHQTSIPHNASPRDKKGSIASQNASESTPPWAELKTKAGKDRKRLPLACIACRRKKIRCSGEKPACKHCMKSRTPCVYKVSTRKAGPRTDYMAMLDKRLKRMEERVTKHIPKEELQHLPDITRAVVRPSQAQQQQHQQPQSHTDVKKRTAKDAFGPDLDQWSASKFNHPNGSTQFPRPRASGYDENNLLAEGRDKLPSMEIQQHLAETYFDYVYGQSYHLLHKPSFMKKLAAGNIPPVLILAVCAISARFSDHPEVKKHDGPPFLRGEEYSDAAREIAQRRFDYPSITILIVLLLLGLHEFGTCQGGRSWMLGGMAHRMAYALQLHKDPACDPTGDPKELLSVTDREIRRRTMWACFLMDRFNSSGTVRPMFGSEDSLQVLQLPIKETLFEQELDGKTESLYGIVKDPAAQDGEGELDSDYDAMGVAAYMIRSISLWGRIIQYINLGGRERDLFPAWDDRSGYKKLHEFTVRFHDTLPELMKYSEENTKIHDSNHEANQYLYLHIVLEQCKLFLNRNALPVATKVADPKDDYGFMQRARQEAVEAAQQISRLLSEAKHYKVVAPFAGFASYMSSAVQVVTAFSRDAATAKRAKDNLKINVDYLEYMKHYWGNFYFLKSKLQSVYKTAADMVKQSSGATTPDTRAEDPQYGNWFDMYPHGVSRADFQAPTSEIKKEIGDDAAMGEKEHPQSVEQFLAGLSPDSKAKHAITKAGGKRDAPTAKKSRRHTANTVSKAGPRRSSQAVSNVPALTTPHSRNVLDSMDLSEATSAYPESYDRSPMLLQHQSTSTPGLPQQSSMQSTPTDSSIPNQVPYGFNQIPPSSYYMPQPQDTGLAYSSYGSMDPSGVGLPDTTNGFWSMDYNPMAGNEGFWHEPQGAWFPPYNMDPPDCYSGDGSNMGDPQQQSGQQQLMPMPQVQTPIDMGLGQIGPGGSDQGQMNPLSRHNSNA